MHLYHHENPLKSTLRDTCYFEKWKFDFHVVKYVKISHFKENNESFGELKKKDGCWVTGNWESTFIGLMSAHIMTSFLYPPSSIFVYLLNIFIDHEHTE